MKACSSKVLDGLACQVVEHPPMAFLSPRVTLVFGSGRAPRSAARKAEAKLE